MACTAHHYEYRQGRYRCSVCGHTRYPKYKIRRTITRSLIITGLLVAGIFVYQNYYTTGILQKEVNYVIDNANNIPPAFVNVSKPAFDTVSKVTSQVGKQVSEPSTSQDTSHETTPYTYSPLSSKPIINIPVLEHKIHDLINAQRTQNNLNPLSFDPQLNLISRAHSQDMANRNYFEHNTPEGLTFFDRYKQSGYTCEKRTNVSQNSYSIMEGGENIFQNNLYNSYETMNGIIVSYNWNDMDALASSTVQGWMHSPGHRENILTPIFDSEGIGVAIASDDKVYITEDFC